MNVILQHVLPQSFPLSRQQGIVAATVVIGVVGLLYYWFISLAQDRAIPGFPVATLDGMSPRKAWLLRGQDVLAEGVRRYPGAFQVITGSGPKIVLPNRFADELRNHPALDHNKASFKDFPTGYPGFEPYEQAFHKDDHIAEVVRVKLTQSLGLITDDLVDETRSALRDIIGEDPEWRTFKIKDAMADVVTRLSSRVFIGKDLCRNRRWLDIAKTYAIDSVITTITMRAVPSFLHPAIYWLLPHARRARRAVKDARAIIGPEVERRKAAVDRALAASEKPPKTADTLGWLYELARARGLDRSVDYSAAQLALSMAAIHTATELTCMVMLDICEYPDVADQLRKEVVDVLSTHGWSKTSLYKLKLMDSFMMEGQRFRPVSRASMHRYVEQDVELSDGTILPEGARILVVGRAPDDAELYPDAPEKFDAARFARKRAQPGQENSWQFVTTTPANLFFGHGRHACPGRFFAINEIKIALCFLLLNYDWRFVPGKDGARPAPHVFEGGSTVHPEAKIQARRREPVLDIAYIAPK